MRWLMSLLIVASSANLAGCGSSKLQNEDEAVKAAWSDVLNQYQRRADLIPNLVSTVKGFVAQEERVLVSVTEARDKVGSVQITPELINNPEVFSRFQAAQSELTQALERLIALAGNYPDLESDANFRDLQAQLAGMEHRIAEARSRYIEAVKAYNVTVREFPTNLTAGMFDYEVRPNFSVPKEAAPSPPAN